MSVVGKVVLCGDGRMAVARHELLNDMLRISIDNTNDTNEIRVVHIKDVMPIECEYGQFGYCDSVSDIWYSTKVKCAQCRFDEQFGKLNQNS